MVLKGHSGNGISLFVIASASFVSGVDVFIHTRVIIGPKRAEVCCETSETVINHGQLRLIIIKFNAGNCCRCFSFMQRRIKNIHKSGKPIVDYGCRSINNRNFHDFPHLSRTSASSVLECASILFLAMANVRAESIIPGAQIKLAVTRKKLASYKVWVSQIKRALW